MAIIEFPLPICGAVVLSSSVSYCMSGNNIVIVLDLFFIGSLELFFLNVSWQNLKSPSYKNQGFTNKPESCKFTFIYVAFCVMFVLSKLF